MRTVNNEEFKEAQEIKEILIEILRWVKFQGMQQLKNVLTDTIQRDTEKIIYENSDGRDSRELADLVGVSHQTVVNYWRKWAILGLVEPMRVRGGQRYRRIFSLQEFGIEVPKTKNSISKQPTKRQSVPGQELESPLPEVTQTGEEATVTNKVEK